MWLPANSNQGSEDASKQIVAVRCTCKLRVKVIRTFTVKHRGSNFTNERKKMICGLESQKKKCQKKCLRKKFKHNRWVAVGPPGVDFPQAVCLIRDCID